ncbi:Etoposide-induced protein 2.4 (EI24) [Planctomycetes bacterium Pla163]|uniref:Etoposide-induced protein 2.4 (EI24) n=1 Tax=Rohdeia mirabilis TaxID=2528008 RepID=A0A518CYW5_9BACT|nr:Etoposide-induced protein 2.4 (EI24) [Planctomycetes bacterium Pla163]
MAQVTAGARAPFVGLGALLTLRGVKRWILPPTLGATLVLAGLLFGLWTLFQEALAGDSEAVDLDLPGWLAWAEGTLEWLLDLPWLRTGGTLAFVLVAALTWWFAYAIVFEVLAGPFLSRMQARAEDHWLGGHGGTPEHPFETRGLGLLALAIGLGAGLWWVLPGGLAAAGLVLPVAVLWFALRPFRGWFGAFVRTEGRSGLQGLVVAAVALIGVVLFLPLHLVPFVGSYMAATAAGFFLALGTLDLALERRGWSLDGRFAFARRSLGALAAFGAVSGFLFGVPVIGPLLMLPSASLGGTWLVAKLDKSALAGEARGNDHRDPGALP